jgi:membrane protease YdiL (CAAX protease family)
MFLAQVYKGKNQFWRYLISIPLVIIGHAAGHIPLMIILGIWGNNQAGLRNSDSRFDHSTFGLDNNLFLILAIFAFIAGLATLIFAISIIHEKPIISIITSRLRLSWSKLFFASGIWLLLSFIFEAISFTFTPEVYEFNLNLGQFIPLFFIVLLGIPFQAGFEEIFIRGYLMQAVGLIGKFSWIPLVTTSLLFGLLHGLNPEIKEFGLGLMMIYYIGVGLFLAVITLMDDGLELALGVHITSNIYASLIVTYQGAALKTSALYTVSSLNVELMLAGYFICAVLFIAIASKKYKWKEWNKLYRKIDRI